jgi:steroid delta-isomerase-like uncharacterized protein
MRSTGTSDAALNRTATSRRQVTKLGLGAAVGLTLAGTAARATHAQDATPETGAETCPSLSLDEAKALVKKYWDEVWNAGNDDALAEVFSENEVHHWGVYDTTEGLDEFLERIALFRAAFPDFQIHVEQTVGEGDLVLSRYRATGTHESEWQGIPGTGRQFEYSGMNLFRIECGKIVESWGEANHLSLLRQLED